MRICLGETTKWNDEIDDNDKTNLLPTIAIDWNRFFVFFFLYLIFTIFFNLNNNILMNKI